MIAIILDACHNVTLSTLMFLLTRLQRTNKISSKEKTDRFEIFWEVRLTVYSLSVNEIQEVIGLAVHIMPEMKD